MPRSARIVIPDIPHHITQRGNYWQQVFFSDEDRLVYLRVDTEITSHSLQVFSPACLCRANEGIFPDMPLAVASRQTTKILSKECEVISAPTLRAVAGDGRTLWDDTVGLLSDD